MSHETRTTQLLEVLNQLSLLITKLNSQGIQVKTVKDTDGKVVDWAITQGDK